MSPAKFRKGQWCVIAPQVGNSHFVGRKVLLMSDLEEFKTLRNTIAEGYKTHLRTKGGDNIWVQEKHLLNLPSAWEKKKVEALWMG